MIMTDIRRAVLAAALAAGGASAQAACLAAVDAALALDIKAATARAEKQPWDGVEKLYAADEQAWKEAAAKCAGPMREKALANQADARRARDHAAGLVESPACEQASASAERMTVFAGEAWEEKRWEDAAMWARKIDLAWESAIAQCAGAKREQAGRRRAAARLDGHNAAVCAPLWERATERTAALKSDLPVLAAADRTARRDEVEVLWSEAAAACRGAAAEKATAMAQGFARERGNRPLPEAATAAPAAPEADGPPPLRGDGASYIGRFDVDADGKVSGNGRVEWDDGDSYEGGIVKGRVHGKGLFVWKNGQRYEGELADGKPAGQGRLTYATSGDRYEGAFAGGVPHGQGTYTWKNGDRYTGGWSRGHKHGHGRYTWADGRSWEGEYADDQRVAGGIVAVAGPGRGAAE